jgi:hypothetical protein
MTIFRQRVWYDCCFCVGRPQFGQMYASVEMGLLQSGQSVRGIGIA